MESKMQLTLKFSVLVMVLLFTGCATKGTNLVDYNAPEELSIENKIVVNKNFDAVWDTLISNISASFFVINNIDKNSRLINISMTSNSPEEFIDCGRSNRTFSFQKETTNYSYLVAKDSFYKYAGSGGQYNQGPAVHHVNRKTALETRINIYVAPEGDERTNVAVNARYVFTTTTSGKTVYYDVMGMPYPTEYNLPVDSNNASFSTQETYRVNASAPGEEPVYLQCKSKGELEAQLLRLAK